MNGERTAESRRFDLMQWLRERREHTGLTARQIADVSGIYSGHGRADRCHDDLVKLAAAGLVWRAGRPAQWFVEAHHA